MAASRLLKVSEKLQKNGLLVKIGRYFKNIYNDYETVAIETWADMRTNKVRSAIYITGLSTAVGLIATNPSETSFSAQLTQNTNDLLIVGDSIRNVQSDCAMQTLACYSNQRRLRRFSFGLFSVMWVDNHDPEVDIYEAHCKQLKVGWLEWKDRIVDIGVVGRWWWLDRAMIDYDINPDEWKIIDKVKSS